MVRIFALIMCAACALLFTACGGGGNKDTADLQPTITPDSSWFEPTAEESAAIARGEDPEPNFSFGDPDLGPVGISTPPALEAPVVLLDGVQQPGSRSVSAAKNKGKSKGKNDPCGRCGKRTCKTKDRCSDATIVGICNISERFTVVCDCCDQFADVCYKAKVLFSNEDCNKDGVEVVFKRDGQEIGRADTDEHGIATFCEERVARGDYDSTVCVWTGQEWADDGKGRRRWSKNKNDGKDNCACDGNAGKGNDWKCGECGKRGGGNDGAWLCSDVEVVVYMTCFRGIWWGKGLINSCLPASSNPSGKAMFNFRNPYQDGNFQGKLTYLDGPIQIIDEPITWMVVNVESAWFGNGKWMARMFDHGQDHLNGDWFEIWIWETATTPEYHNKGFLLNCFTTASFAYTHKCPDNNKPMK